MNTNTAINYGTNVMSDSSQIEPVKVIARYLDGNVVKGHTHDFFPSKDIFRISPSINDPSKERTKIQMLDLKALFFVRSFAGDSSYNEQKQFLQDKQLHGRKIEVTFRDDDELLAGTTVGYNPNRLGFFIVPVDPKSNNLRVFVISAAVKKVWRVTEKNRNISEPAEISLSM
jgi:hypothetical protein